MVKDTATAGNSLLKRIIDKARALPILAVAAVMLAIAVMSSSISILFTLYALGKVALFGYLGYWIDRVVFPYGRPHLADGEDLQVFASIRRAIIVAACIIAAGLVP